jgi:hypothetical protein
MAGDAELSCLQMMLACPSCCIVLLHCSILHAVHEAYLWLSMQLVERAEYLWSSRHHGLLLLAYLCCKQVEDLITHSLLQPPEHPELGLTRVLTCYREAGTFWVMVSKL